MIAVLLLIVMMVILLVAALVRGRDSRLQVGDVLVALLERLLQLFDLLLVALQLALHGAQCVAVGAFVFIYEKDEFKLKKDSQQTRKIIIINTFESSSRSGSP